MLTPTKLVAGLIGLGAIGGIGAYAWGLSSSPEEVEKVTQDIALRLKWDGYLELYDTLDQARWDAVLEDYKNSETQTFLSEPTPKAHREKCLAILKLDKDHPAYADAKRWCVVREKMSVILEKAGFKVLKSKPKVSLSEKGYWAKKIEELKKLETKPFKELQNAIKDGDDQVENNINLLRAECEKMNIEETYPAHKDFETKFELSKKWCSISRNDWGQGEGGFMGQNAKKLISAGYQILDFEDDKGWDEVLIAYKLINKQDEIFSGSKLGEETKENLKQKCEEALSGDKEYELASRWCVREQTIAEMLKNNGYTKLRQSKSSEQEKQKWIEKLNKLEKALKDQHNIIEITLTGTETDKLNSLQTFCNSLNIDTLRTRQDKEFGKKFDQAKEWCSEKIK